MLSFFFLLLWVGCGEPTAGPGNPVSASDSALITQPPGNRETILNNIVVEEKGGLQVATAFLADEAGNLINPKNTVTIGSPVFLTVQVKEGWKIQDGFVSPGAVQTITTHNSEPVLQSSDLFAGVQRIKASDAATLRLKVLITATRPDIAFYKIRFRIWDKKGSGEITGHYQLRLED